MPVLSCPTFLNWHLQGFIRFMPTFWLSWNSARLLALILNALNGLFDYYHQNHQELSLEQSFVLEFAKGQFCLKKFRLYTFPGYLNGIYPTMDSFGYHRDILATVKNLSETAHIILDKASTSHVNALFQDIVFLQPENFAKLSSVIKPKPYRKVDERYRWSQKSSYVEHSSQWFQDNFIRLLHFYCPFISLGAYANSLIHVQSTIHA